jgi:hypothetical protein
MDKAGYSSIRTFYWVTEILLLIVSTGSLFLDFRGILPQIDWRLIAAGAILFFAISAFRHIILIESDLISRTPRVRMASDPYLDFVQMNSGKPIIISPKGDTIGRNISRFVKVSFANVPKHNTENNHATRVTARLTYFDEKGRKLVGPIYARWSNSIPPKTRDDLRDIIYYQLDSSGKPEPIDIAFKIDSEGSCYAYNNEAYFASDLKVPEFEIKVPVVNVKIELRGERVNRNFKMQFRNDGTNTPIRITEHISWLRRWRRKS